MKWDFFDSAVWVDVWENKDFHSEWNAFIIQSVEMLFFYIKMLKKAGIFDEMGLFCICL